MSYGLSFTQIAATLALAGKKLKLNQLKREYGLDLDARQSFITAEKRKEVREALSGEGSPEAEQRAHAIKSASEECYRLQGLMDACDLEMVELDSQILASLRADKAARRNEVDAERKRIIAEQEECRKVYLTALAAAGVAQMRYLGFWRDMERKGPGLGLKVESDWEFFRIELARLWADAGLDSSHNPSDRVKTLSNVALALDNPVTAEDVNNAIEAARRLK